MKALKRVGYFVYSFYKEHCRQLYKGSGGRTRHMEAKMYWLRELKEEEQLVIVPVYCPSELNRSDVYTKNVCTWLFEEHVTVFCTDD